MSGPLDFLNPVNDLAKLADSIIGKFVADPQEKAANQLALLQTQAAAQQGILDFQAKFAEQQAKVITTEAASEGWLTKSWRPLTMLTFLAIILYQGPMVSIFGWHPVDYTTIPDRMWSLLELGIGGYIGGRTVEKAAPAIGTAVSKVLALAKAD